MNFQESVYINVMSVLRNVFDSNYGKTKSTKYKIVSSEDYKLAISIVDKIATSKQYPLIKFQVESFKDLCLLEEEIQYYERSNKITKQTFNDYTSIQSWREYKDIGVTHSLFDALHTGIILEFC
jgi:hypothetical protein